MADETSEVDSVALTNLHCMTMVAAVGTEGD